MSAQTSFFKATRPDGTDFYSGKVDYGAALLGGEPVTHHVVRQVKGDASTYLSVCTVPTDCTGMSWPCRLFRVVPAGCRPLEAGGSLKNKRRLHALRVVEELPAHEVFGPQGREVAALIVRAGKVTTAEVKRFNAAKDAAWDAAREAATGAARDAARYAARYAAGHAARDAAWDAATYAARYAARYAAGALVVKDLVTAEQFTTLYGPWASAMETE